MNIKTIQYVNRHSKNKYIRIEVVFNYTCNYKCLYCFINHFSIPDIHNNLSLNKILKSYVDVDSLFKYIVFLYNNTNKNIILAIIGGEPTLHPSLLSFCKRLEKYKNYVNIEIYTNGTADNKLYYDLLNISNVHIDFSYHSINNNLHLDFFKKLLTLFKYKQYSIKQICITIMLEHIVLKSLNMINKIILNNKLVKKFVVEYKLIKDYGLLNNKSYYSDEEKLFIKQNLYNYNIFPDDFQMYEVTYDNGKIETFTNLQYDFLFHNNIKNLNTKIICNAGLEYMLIDADNSVFRCPGEYWECKSEHAIKITDKNMKYFTTQTICSNKMYGCEFGCIKRFENI